MRLVADLADWDTTRQGIPLGQSGDPRSPHWKDQLASWETVAPMPFPFTRAAVERAAVTVTEFAPPDQKAGGQT
jgi:penicillin amidase